MRVDDQNRRIGGVSLDRKQSLTKNLDRRTTPQRIYETTVLRYLLLDYHHLPPCSVLLPAVSSQRTSAGEIRQEYKSLRYRCTHARTTGLGLALELDLTLGLELREHAAFHQRASRPQHPHPLLSW